jgi:outer membrane protein TolC
MNSGEILTDFRLNTINSMHKPMKKPTKSSLLVLLFLIPVLTGSAQSVLTPYTFLKQIELYHPVARQANLRIDQSVASVLSAKGIFDPVIDYQHNAKVFAGDDYYNYNNPELKLFTPLGISIKAGAENNLGKYINPEFTRGTLSYAGIEMPVLRGLLIDKKRAALKQAEIFVNQAETEKQAMLNDLYLDAITDYWLWAAAYQELQVVNQNLQVAEERFELTRILFANGENSAGDTTEALGQIFSLQLQQAAMLQQYQKTGINLSQYLWGENQEPYMLAEGTEPEIRMLLTPPALLYAETLTENIPQHPLIRTLDYQLSVLAVERRLKQQNLLPELMLKANLLSKDYFRFESNITPYLANNYKFGIAFNVPLFLRESRGELQKTSLKIEETLWKQKQKSWELETKILQYQAELLNIRNQTELGENLITNYQRMLELEELRFSQGESSLFVINSRQNKLIDSYLKLIELRVKYIQTWFRQQWAAGLLNNTF